MAKAQTTIARRFLALAEIAATLVGMVIAAALIGGLIAPLAPENLRTPIIALGLYGAVLTGALLLRLTKSSYRELGLRMPRSWIKTLGWAVLALVICNIGAAGINAIIRATTDWPPLDVTYIRSSIEGDTLAYVIWIVIVVWGSAAFGEELFARGFVLDRLRIVFGRGVSGGVIASVLQAALFGALHAIQGPTGIVITAFIGLVFAAIYFASGRNLWTVILAHGITDTISLTLMYAGMPLPGGYAN